MRTGQARKRDGNEQEIVEALEDIGVTIRRVSGKGCPDLLAYHWREGWRLLEVKREKGSLTEAQQDTFAAAPFCVVHSVAEALALYGIKA